MFALHWASGTSVRSSLTAGTGPYPTLVPSFQLSWILPVDGSTRPDWLAMPTVPRPQSVQYPPEGKTPGLPGSSHATAHWPSPNSARLTWDRSESLTSAGRMSRSWGPGRDLRHSRMATSRAAPEVIGGPDQGGAPPGLSEAGAASADGEGEGDGEAGEEAAVEVEEPFAGEVVDVVISC
jgi:hypothetical protein